MGSTQSWVQYANGDTASWKDGSWKKKNISRRNDSSIHETEIKISMNISLTGNKKTIKTGPQKQTLGHASKGQSQIKNSRVGVSRDGESAFNEQMSKDTKGPNEHVTVKKPPKRQQLDDTHSSFSGAEVRPGARHQSIDILQPGSRLVSSSGSSLGAQSVSDYLVLLKSLHINLPKGVVNSKVIKLSQNADIIQNAGDIVTDLESFKLQFNSRPRLGCRELRNSLSLKDNQNVLEIAVMIFFAKTEGSMEKLRAEWGKNVSNTSCEFRLRDKYKTMPISTPDMYATTRTRSWGNLGKGDAHANISKGVAVNIRSIEKRDYQDESAFWMTSSPQRFGKYFQNPKDECECLKFFHELGEIGKNRKVMYTKGNKIEFGFLSGKLDFLAEIKGEGSERMVIECKGTTGDMVGKVFTKPKNGGRCAQLHESHEYYYQVQAYMYILNRAAKETKSFMSDRAVMVIRHYHKNGQVPRDFYWNYL